MHITITIMQKNTYHSTTPIVISQALSLPQTLRPGRTVPFQRPNGSNDFVKTPTLYRPSQRRSYASLVLDTTTTEAYPLPACLPERVESIEAIVTLSYVLVSLLK